MTDSVDSEYMGREGKVYVLTFPSILLQHLPACGATPSAVQSGVGRKYRLIRIVAASDAWPYADQYGGWGPSGKRCERTMSPVETVPLVGS
ncbi:MAG: hypothetical protein KatS3mg130_1760 [Candidatus Sumerlaea sp.]|nr:MAG: hypothetical protein KatS3mg130_1760 [Candidatus Sumerlaea sp.]